MAHLHISQSGDKSCQPRSLLSFVDILSLTSVPPSTCTDGDFKVELNEILQESTHVHVFRATITSPQDAAFHFQAVIKFACSRETVDALKREAGFYQHQLRHLQGQYIPHMFGLFIGTTVQGEIAALVTSDEGRQLRKPFYHLPLQFR